MHFGRYAPVVSRYLLVSFIKVLNQRHGKNLIKESAEVFVPLSYQQLCFCVKAFYLFYVFVRGVQGPSKEYLSAVTLTSRG